MRKFAWITDTHFNLVSQFAFKHFVKRLKKRKPNAIFLTGDVSNGTFLVRDLLRLTNSIDVPIYFVLGNHDYWHETIQRVQDNVRSVCSITPNLVWMNNVDYVKISDNVSVIGHDGWYDAQVGWNDPESIVFKPDWYNIRDFKILKKNKNRLSLAQNYAAYSASCAALKLRRALSVSEQVFFLTHFPPWPEQSPDMFKGFWLPYNHSQVMGNTLKKIMFEHPLKQLHVLCGHTHAHSYSLITNNITMNVGKATYGRLRIEDPIMI